MPYFNVEFGNCNGYAHVIEDEAKFPFQFAEVGARETVCMFLLNRVIELTIVHSYRKLLEVCLISNPDSGKILIEKRVMIIGDA